MMLFGDHRNLEAFEVAIDPGQLDVPDQRSPQPNPVRKDIQK